MNDTICAVSTPPGVGGIAVIRLSGQNAFQIFAPIWHGKAIDSLKSHTTHLGLIADPTTGEHIDEALITVFRAPRSYTGEDTVEISVHGSSWIQSRLLKLLIAQGARLSEPGEFTRRAFVNGNMDLAQAEAVGDLIAARSRAAHRIAASQMKGSFSHRLNELRDELLNLASLLELELDFSDQHVEFASRTRLREAAENILAEIRRLADSFDRGQAIAEGIPVVIVGETNAGKSTLLNRLIEHDRAIVSEHRGTTRDTIEEIATIDDLLFRFIDTAGIRDTHDPVEAMGIERSRQALSKAPIILWVVDSTQTAAEIQKAYGDIFTRTDRENKTLIAVLNKTDLARNKQLPELSPFGVNAIIPISAATGEGLPKLRKTIRQLSGITTDESDITVTNLRHYEALTRAAASIEEVIHGLDTDEFPEFLAQSLRETLSILAEITGAVTDTDILTNIFSHFCIGK